METSTNGVVPPEELERMFGQPPPEEDESDTGETSEEEDTGLPGDAPVPSPGPSIPFEQIAAAAGALGARTGATAQGLLGKVGDRIDTPDAPGEDFSDLFEGPDMDTDNDVYIKDLVSIDEEDVFGTGGEDMSDILTVTEEDVMGPGDENMSELLEVDEASVLGVNGVLNGEQRREQQPAFVPRRPVSRPAPPAGLSGLRG